MSRSVEVLWALPNEALITPSEGATLLAATPRLLSEWRVKRSGPTYVKVGNQVRYRMGAVREWLAGRERQTVTRKVVRR